MYKSEGVRFDRYGRAHSSQRLSAAELATLLGKDVTPQTEYDPLPDGENTEVAARFRDQLLEHRPETVTGVTAALDFWRRQGGHLDYGRHDETSCYLMLDAGTSAHPHLMWPMVLYPVSGTVEVVFQYLKDRAPFDDTEQRRELLRRLNEVDGIDLPEAKLELRPSFPLQAFAAQGEAVCAALDWFIHTAALDLARRA